MKEQEQKVLKIELQHYQQVAETVKVLRKIDGFMYDSLAIKAALDQAFSTGEIGVFMLDCIVADQVATEGGIGKVPLSDLGEVVAKSPLIAQFGSIKYIIETLKSKGLDVSIWAFIGDDDFQHSVSPEYSVANSAVQQGLNKQIQALGNRLQQETASLGAKAHVSGWLLQETTYPDVLQSRGLLLGEITTGIDNSTLPAEIIRRFNSFVKWRVAVITKADIDPIVLQSLIQQQAIQELVSFVTQGNVAPDIVHKQVPGLPLIFANTYPDVGTQHLDDECVRLGYKLGLSGYRYGTIHLPGPEKLAKFLGEPNDPNFKQIIFSCNGEKVMGEKRGKWQKEERKAIIENKDQN